MNEIICAIDIGCSKVSVMVAKPSQSYASNSNNKTATSSATATKKLKNKAIEVLAYETTANFGMKGGLITDIEKTIKALQFCLDRVSAEIGYPINYACISVAQSGTHIVNSKGIARIETSQVSAEDIASAIELAEVFNFSNDQQLLHRIIQRFWVDGRKMANPMDIYGLRLEVDCLLIAAQKQVLDNLYYCLNSCNVRVIGTLISPLNSALAILRHEEQQFGVILLDIGADLTDVAIYQNYTLTYINSYAIAGSQVTEGIADYFHTSIEIAEKLKRNYGCAKPNQLENPEEEISIFSTRDNEDRLITLGEFSDIVSNYYCQTLEKIRAEIQKEYSIDNFANFGIVLTGGFSSAPSIDQLVREVFNNLPVRIGLPDSAEINALPDNINPAELANIAGIIIQANQIYHQQNNTLIELAKLNNYDTQFSYGDQNSKKVNLKEIKNGFFSKFNQKSEKHF